MMGVKRKKPVDQPGGIYSVVVWYYAESMNKKARAVRSFPVTIQAGSPRIHNQTTSPSPTSSTTATACCLARRCRRRPWQRDNESSVGASRYA